MFFFFILFHLRFQKYDCLNDEYIGAISYCNILMLYQSEKSLKISKGGNQNLLIEGQTMIYRT